MNPLLDTIMNIEVFVFIGVMVWLYMRPADIDRQDTPHPENPGRAEGEKPPGATTVRE